MNIKCLSVFGDSKLVVNQVKSKYGIKKFQLKEYSKKVWDLTDHFQAFNITFIHREKNHNPYSLAIIASMFSLCDPEMTNSFNVSMLYKPTILDNEGALKVFENDENGHFFLVGLE
jgi:hypothetical protein